MYQTRNLLRIAIFNISYIRGLFPEKYFNDKSVPALGKITLQYSSCLRVLLFTIYTESSKSLNLIYNYGLMTEMKIKKLLPVDADSRRLIDWMEKGTFKLLSD